MSDAQARAPGRRLEQIRPLSPHLQIYKWTWTMAMSVFHRLTGVALYGGTILIVWWLVALAAGPGPYSYVQGAINSFLGRIILFGFTWAIFHHMLGGIRHFIWDFGYGFEKEARHALARLTLIGSAVLTLLVWVIGYLVR